MQKYNYERLLASQCAFEMQRNFREYRKINTKSIKELLDERYKPIRLLTIFDISVLSIFKKIIPYFDLPYRLSFKKNKIYRYLAKVYGAFFDKDNRSYTLYFSTGTKKNIGVLMSYFINYPSSTHLCHSVDWHKFSFLYEKTLIYRYNVKYNILYFLKKYKINKNLTPINNFYKKLIPISTHIFYKRFHRSLNLSDIDLNCWLSTHDFRHQSIDIYNKTYSWYSIDKLKYTWAASPFYLASSFFIKNFDSKLILYPELYFKYINKLYNQTRLINFIKKSNKIKNNNNNIIINLYNNHYLNLLKKNLFNFKNKFRYFNNKYSKIFKFSILFLKKNNILQKNIKKDFFIFKSNKIKKSFLIKSYLYFKSRKKYYRKKKLYICYRSYFSRKIPKKSKYSLIATRSYFIMNKIFRSFYMNYSYYIIKKIKKFWNYFFTFFIKNIKKRYFFTNNIIIDSENITLNLTLFIRKFLLFQQYIKTYLKADYTNRKYLIYNKYINKKNKLINIIPILYNNYSNYYNYKIKKIKKICKKLKKNIYSNVNTKNFKNIISKDTKNIFKNKYKINKNKNKKYKNYNILYDKKIKRIRGICLLEKLKKIYQNKNIKNYDKDFLKSLKNKFKIYYYKLINLNNKFYYSKKKKKIIINIIIIIINIIKIINIIIIINIIKIINIIIFIKKNII